MFSFTYQKSPRWFYQFDFVSFAKCPIKIPSCSEFGQPVGSQNMFEVQFTAGDHAGPLDNCRDRWLMAIGPMAVTMGNSIWKIKTQSTSLFTGARLLLFIALIAEIAIANRFRMLEAKSNHEPV